jgi:hypothetical protein
MKLFGLSFPREDTSNEAEGGITPKSKAGTDGCAADHVSQSRTLLECSEFLLLPETRSRGKQNVNIHPTVNSMYIYIGGDAPKKSEFWLVV